jgi:hypothetical protein
MPNYWMIFGLPLAVMAGVLLLAYIMHFFNFFPPERTYDEDGNPTGWR